MSSVTKKTIDIQNILGQAAGFRADGRKIRKELESNWDDFDRLIIKMRGIKGASPSFLDEAFAKLFLKYPRAEVVRKLCFNGLSHYHRANLNGLAKIRLRQQIKREGQVAKR